MKNLIIIPTYWTLPEENTFERFDHPVPIQESGTLERLLQSLRVCKVRDEIHVIIAPLHSKVEKKVRSITNKFPDLDIHVFTRVDMKKILQLVKTKKFSKQFLSEINVNDYGSLRNISLIIGLMKKVDNIILIDDDEIIEDKKYMAKAVERMGQKIGKKRLVGKSGYYLDKNNNYRPLKKAPKWKKHWLKQKHLNKIYNRIKSKKRFHKTSFALGGNMVINKELFSTVPFDPYITRGEHVDYLLNTKHFKFLVLFDNQLVVKHLPPPLPTPYWLKLRRDIYRFIYEKEKLKYFNFNLQDLDSYPKFFLGKYLEQRAIITSIEYAKYCLKKGDKEGHRESLNTAKLVENEAKLYAKKHVPKYFRFQEEWKKLSLLLDKIIK